MDINILLFKWNLEKPNGILKVPGSFITTVILNMTGVSRSYIINSIQMFLQCDWTWWYMHNVQGSLFKALWHAGWEMTTLSQAVHLWSSTTDANRKIHIKLKMHIGHASLCKYFRSVLENRPVSSDTSKPSSELQTLFTFIGCLLIDKSNCHTFLSNRWQMDSCKPHFWLQEAPKKLNSF